MKVELYGIDCRAIRQRHVRFGSLADIAEPVCDVRFVHKRTSEN